MSSVFDFSIDWLEFTYRDSGATSGEEVWQSFCNSFPEIMLDWEKNTDQVVLLGHGRNFYDTVFLFSDEYFISYHSEKEKMGVHVTFTGHGIWKISDIFGFNNINETEACKKLFQILDDRNCTITRLDIAYDDYTKTFCPEDFSIWMHQRRITTECMSWNYITSLRSSGDTFYLGKRGRERYLRIYDKNYESDGKINAIRYEFELKENWSNTIKYKVLNDELFSFADLLDSMFTVKEDWGFDGQYEITEKGNKVLSGSDRQKLFRANIDEKWLLFLDTIRKTHDSSVIIKLKKEKEQYSFIKMHRWLNEYIASSLFIYRSVVGSDSFNKMIDEMVYKLTPRKKAMISKFNIEKDDFFEHVRQKLDNVV